MWRDARGGGLSIPKLEASTPWTVYGVPGIYIACTYVWMRHAEERGCVTDTFAVNED